MRRITFTWAAMVMLAMGGWAAVGQLAEPSPREQLGRSFEAKAPQVGEPLPDLEAFDSNGKAIKLSSLQGHYTVLVFGCLTRPPFLQKVSGLEALSRDYAPQGVKFYFLYKALAHPETNGYLAPFSLAERLLHVKQAQRTLGGSIPWLCDAITNDVKHALGDAPNSEFLIDPAGKVARRRAWCEPAELRKDLERLVGPIENPTRFVEVDLSKVVATKAAAGGVVPRVRLPGRASSLRIEPRPSTTPFYAKLRVEAEDSVLRRGEGKLYLGFHLDPLYRVHWNNLVESLSYEITAPAGVTVTPATGSGPAVDAITDSDPREFLVEVRGRELAGRDDSDPPRRTLQVRVKYFACHDEEGWCKAITQHYTVHLEADRDGGWVQPRSRSNSDGRTQRRMPPSLFGGLEEP